MCESCISGKFVGCVVFLFPMLLSAQLTWTALNGGVQEDWAQCVRQVSDGGYVIVGGTRSFGAGESDLWLMKLDSLGDTLWSRTYGGAKSDYGVSAVETSDGSYAVLGVTKSYGAAGSNLWLLKVGKSGNKLWATTFGGSEDDLAYNFRETSEGGFIIVGETHSYGAGQGDLWLIKTDEQGNTSWSRTFGGDSLDWGEDICLTADGGYLITGGTRSFDVIQTDLWLLKVDSSANQEWSRTYGWRSWEWGKCLHETKDGGYIIAGPRDTIGTGMYDAWLLRINSMGDSLWAHKYGGNKWDWVNSLDVTSDGGYVFTGETQSAGKGNYDLWLYKVDSLGDSIWAYTYGDTGWEWGSSIHETSDGGFVIGGATSSFSRGENDLWLLKTDSVGKIGYEVSPTRIIKPQGGDVVATLIPSAIFGNFRRGSTSNIYFHCVIVSVDSQYFYHDSLTYYFDPWSTSQVDFSKWVAGSITEYTATFYATSVYPLDPIRSRPMSVTFQWTGVEEQRDSEPSFELITSLGRQVVLGYSGYSEGFDATIFDASGRKVDEMHSSQTSGTVSWGEGHSPGVYFIQTDQGGAKPQKVILVK